MRRKGWLLASGLIVIAAWAIPSSILAGGAPAHNFVGAEKCKMCHNSPAKGAQFTKWSESAHAKAYATLGGEEAKKIAASKGLGDPQKAPECLRCHVAGQGAPAASLTDKYKIQDSVSCESCHGPGGDYWKMEVMKDPAKAAAAGMMKPTEETCKGCHNADGPTFKGFDFAVMSAKIAHPNPLKAAGK